MAVLKLPFTDSNEADTHEEGLFQCGLFRMLPEPVQEVTRESVHLLEYMHMVPIEKMGIPEYYPELTRKLGDLKEPNLIYPVGQGIFTHIFPNNDSGRNTYISVEPLLTSNVIDLSREVKNSWTSQTSWATSRRTRTGRACSLGLLTGSAPLRATASPGEASSVGFLAKTGAPSRWNPVS